jgi:hypothetical protein
VSEALDAQGGFYEAFAATAARQIDGPAILVAHSGAGGLVPSILRNAGGRVQAVIFVDALLPHPGRSWFDTVPAALATQLRREARAGRAPPWPSWLPSHLLERFLPESGMRESLTDDAPCVPVAFLEEPAPEDPPPAPPHGCAYLQLSSAYDREAGQAREWGWPVERLDGHHLSIMVNPPAVAVALVDLASTLLELAP